MTTKLILSAVTASALAFWPLPTGLILPKIVALSAGLLLAALFYRQEHLLEIPSRAPLAAGIAAAALVVSAAASDDVRLSILGRYNDWSYGLWAMSLCLAVFVLAAGAFEDDAPPLRWLAWLAVGLSVQAVLQRLHLDPIMKPSVIPPGRAIATTGTPYDLGAILAMLLPAALELHPVAAAAVALGLWASAARGAWLAAAAGIAAMFAGHRRLPIIFVAALWIPAVFAGFATKQKDIARAEVWVMGLKAAQEHPVLGSGPDTFAYSFKRLRTEKYTSAMNGSGNSQGHAHNDIYQAAATTGIVGLLAYLLLWAAILAGHSREAVIAGLLALWVNLKVNPVSVEVIALGALLAGLRCRGTIPKASAPIAAAVAIASLATCAWLWQADYLMMRGLVFDAAQLNPCESTYAAGIVNHYNGKGVLRVAKAAAECRPKDSQAQYALAVAYDHEGKKWEALAHARRALQLDPGLKPLRAFNAELAAFLAKTKR